jgi:hypothetical protein
MGLPPGIASLWAKLSEAAAVATTAKQNSRPSLVITTSDLWNRAPYRQILTTAAAATE